MVVPADVARWEDVHRARHSIEAELGPIDVWVNNAMSSIFAPFTEISMDEFARANEVNYMGFVHGTKAALDSMVDRGSGVIVQVGSALAYRGIPLQSAYCGAKHAIVGFTESVRTELLHDKSGRPRDHGAHAGNEHSAVRLGAVPPSQATPTGAADLPARSRRPSSGLRRRSSHGDGRTTSACRPP